MISVISWRIAGSDGYQRHFDREDEALEAFSKVTVMVNIESVLERVSTTYETIAIKPKSGKD
jgi:hypothetical protein